MTNISKLAFYGYEIDYRQMADGFILIRKPWGCVNDDDIALVREVTQAPDYMVFKADYQLIGIG